MNILIAPNAFKGTIEADAAAAIIRKSLFECDNNLEFDICPIADGGDGTCFLLGTALGLGKRELFALDAVGRPRLGYYFLDEDKRIAYLDVSTVSGIKFLKTEQINPWIANSYGTGELINDAILNGANHVVLGLGGSASIDLGIGILRGLGYLFLDGKGRELSMFSDTLLSKIKYVQIPIQKRNLSFTFLCDVDNTFFGEKGAIPVFGPQKGLHRDQQKVYEALCVDLIQAFKRKVKQNKDIHDSIGFGAAGGIAYGLAHFFPISVEMGAKWFFSQIGIEERVQKADIIITGEGKYDSQSAGGKGSYELLQIAKKYKKKTILITSGEEGKQDGFDLVMTLPNLDFNNTDFQSIAKSNLKQVSKDIYVQIMAS